MLRRTSQLTSRTRSVNRYDDPIAQRLKPLLRDASNKGPAKVLALKIGVSPSAVRDAKEERRFVSAQALLRYAQHDPAIAREVLAIISGEAEAGAPANIDKLIRFFTQRGSG